MPYLQCRKLLIMEKQGHVIPLEDTRAPVTIINHENDDGLVNLHEDGTGVGHEINHFGPSPGIGHYRSTKLIVVVQVQEKVMNLLQVLEWITKLNILAQVQEMALVASPKFLKLIMISYVNDLVLHFENNNNKTK